MAENKVLIELIISEKGSKATLVQKETEKLSKSTDKVDKSRKKLNKTTDNTNKREKALYQTNLSSAKGFSKMKETMGGGGSSGLVAAYATLAANVFAATAAFNALRQAAQVQTLVEGFTVLANESGRTATVVAEGLREIAQGALSMEEALRASSLALSSGFSTAQLEELTQVATNASLALGRNLGDSVDRLIRGVAKLEPEILDELGIMVRLDTAVENYAASIGKSASALTDFERRQAFLNESITQGQRKFGMMEGAVELSSWERLGATFNDLANNILGFISSAFGPLLDIISKSQTAMLGLLVWFGSGIMTSMIPALNNLGVKQAERAMQLRQNADLEMKDAEAMRQSAKEALNKGKSSVKRKGREKLTDAGDKAGVKEYKKELNLVQRDINTMEGNKKKYSKAETARRKKHLEELRQYKRELNDVIRKEEKRNKILMRGGKSERAIMGGDASAAAADRIGMTGGGFAGSKEGFKIANEEFGKYKTKMMESQGVQDTLQKSMGKFGKIGGWISKAFLMGGTAVRIFGAALLNAIPFIGQIIFAISIIINLFKNWFGASEKMKAAQESYNKVLESVPEKIDQINTTSENMAAAIYAQTGAVDEAIISGAKYVATLEVAAGMTDELTTATIGLNKVIAEEGASVFAHWGNVISEGFGSAWQWIKDGAKAASDAIKETDIGQWYVTNIALVLY